jgi:glutamyl/glutaminyl-tRNA synthetase
MDQAPDGRPADGPDSSGGVPADGWGRFAPSTTGPSHPGTLLAALLCWLDARRRGLRVALRLEDLDRERSRAPWIRAMRYDLEWLGLDWDRIDLQRIGIQ